jgi:hypothetical protein
VIGVPAEEFQQLNAARASSYYSREERPRRNSSRRQEHTAANYDRAFPAPRCSSAPGPVQGTPQAEDAGDQAEHTTRANTNARTLRRATPDKRLRGSHHARIQKAASVAVSNCLRDIGDTGWGTAGRFAGRCLRGPTSAQRTSLNSPERARITCKPLYVGGSIA